MARHKTRHPPPSLRCPHCGGRSRDLFYHSTYRTRDGPRTLWRCRRCGKGLSERRGTAFFNLKTPEAEVARSLDAMAARRHADFDGADTPPPERDVAAVAASGRPPDPLRG